MADVEEENREAQEAWNRNARFWDERMSEGNDFFTLLIWPAVERLLRPREGERLLDVACGNGLTSRRLAAAGARVVAIDFAEEMIKLAKERARGPEIDYRVVDATDEDALLELGEGTFEGALCNMALMDMAAIGSLMAALARLLRAKGRFVFSVLHPCFNNPSTVLASELQDRRGSLSATRSVKVSRYLTPCVRPGLAMSGQPAPHPYFHRPLGLLFGAAFEAGFVVDAIVEPAFPPGKEDAGHTLSWSGAFSEIPPVLIARMRR